jgi:hypothetical protein
MMSGLARATLLVALVSLACRYDSGWDQGATLPDATAPPPGRTVTEGPDGSAPAPAAGQACDLLASTCPAGQACYRYACASAGGGAPGDHCNEDSECRAGALCQTSTATCRALCRNVDPDDCGQWCCPSQHCVLLNDPRLPGELGYCLP